MCFSQSILYRKRKHPNYKLLDSYFQVDRKSMRSKGYHSNFPIDEFRVNYFEVLNLIMASIRTRFDHPSFIACSLTNDSRYLEYSVPQTFWCLEQMSWSLGKQLRPTTTRYIKHSISQTFF